MPIYVGAVYYNMYIFTYNTLMFGIHLSRIYFRNIREIRIHAYMLQCVHLLFKHHIYVIHTNIQTYIHTYVHVYTYMHTYIDIHT